MTVNFFKILSTLFLLGSLWASPVFSQELKIDRKERLVSYLQDSDQILKRWRKVGDDLYEARFIVLPNIFDSNENQTSNPFLDSPIKPNNNEGNSPQKILEDAGVVFGKGARVAYAPSKRILTVIQNRKQMKLVEAYITPLSCGPAKQIFIRAEIYELPSSQALKLLESCEGQSDHSPERNAIHQLTQENGAQLVALPSVISRSGQRSKISSTYEVPFLTTLPQKPKKEGEAESETSVGSRSVGTIFEVDPVLGADNWTIDLSFNLEHHTGPPEPFTVSKGIEIPIFHSKEITTQITLLKGNYVLIGAWKPTGKPEYEKTDLMQVVFLTANVQNLNDCGVLQPVVADKKEATKE